MAPKPVELSTTLRDLYNEDGGKADDVALVYGIPVAASAACPAATKYAYQSPYGMTNKVGPETQARFVLGCLMQLHGFVAGPMELHLFDVGGLSKVDRAYALLTWSSETERPHRVDARRVFERLGEDQRPDLRWVEKAEDVLQVAKRKRLAVTSPMDFLDANGHGANTLVDQDTHWDMLSKQTLAKSGLPTPPTKVVASASAEPSVSQDDEAGIISGMLNAVEVQPLPFVFKLPYGYGGQAVQVIKDEAMRQKCLTMLRTRLPALLPTCLLLQDVMPGNSVAISIFVTITGRAIFISASEEVHDPKSGSWSGGIMDYSRHDVLAAQYKDIVQQASDYVFQRGFHGPMGIDVMTDDAGKQYVIDLNVRQIGSYTLGLLKKHFWENHNLAWAGLLCPVPILGTRDSFEGKFASEIESGSLIIVSWCHGKWAGGLITYSAAGVVVGAKTRDDLLELMGRVNACAIKY
ncbi:hypothetical protein DOTSEDRAFT_27384 [Dothistroma septosporum NZE10]|uniref:ATP-grasp domain-containing protein n=1 Tax=Dothistroma septosporum (strain NZE10 / CBS 128990) TaxID=675120 RepID=N1PDU7_DOTSN|nr:hypothetical protein DOTSEDRAFT_27384 [Dothistroma septosporum NZE10]